MSLVNLLLEPRSRTGLLYWVLKPDVGCHDAHVMFLLYLDRLAMSAPAVQDHADLPAAHQEALQKMRDAFADVDGFGMKMNDGTYLRYLRARNFNFEKSKHMLENTLKWREEFGLKDFHNGQWKDIIALENSTGKMYARGFDRQGHLMVYMKPKEENTNDHDGNIKHLVFTMERAVACIEKYQETHGGGDGKLSLIIDYDGYSLRNAPPMKTSRETLSVLQDHYPERLFCAYCIRPPYIVYGFFKVISPFIDPVTKNKICMLTNADMGKSDNKLYQDCDISILEPCVGGSDSRPFDSKMYLGAPFDEEFYATINAN
jgi:hypothetical protein